MAGIGKTTLATQLYHDTSVKEKIECRAFVRVGQKYEFEVILRAIIAQLNIVDSDDKLSVEGDHVDFKERFKTSLRGRRFLIVLDDLWDAEFQYTFKRLLPRNGYLLVTSRIEEIFGDSSNYYHHHRMKSLKEEESWELLKRKVFGEEEKYLPLLVKPGKKIAEDCDALPLLILAIAKLLLESPKEPDYWNEVAEMQNSVF